MEIKWFVKDNSWITSRGVDGGWGNGYAVIPPVHPCFGMDYVTIQEKYDGFDHELTYSSMAVTSQKEPFSTYVGNWIVGFDTLHAFQTLAQYSKERVEQDAAKMAFRFYEIWIQHVRKVNNEKSD